MPVLKSFTIDQSVMHVALAGDIPLSEPSVMAVDLSAAGYARLLDFIVASFSRPEGSEVPLIGQSYGADDAFFEAEGAFERAGRLQHLDGGGTSASGDRHGVVDAFAVAFNDVLALA